MDNLIFTNILILFFMHLIFPMFCFLRIKMNKAYLETDKIRLQMGFFYIGYNSEYYFWEFVIMFRKILIIFVTLIPDSLIYSKAALVLFLVTTSFYLHSNSHPYINANLNKLEFYAILVSICTIFFGMFYLSQINDYLKAFIFAMIIFSNAYFLFIWSRFIIARSFKNISSLRKFETLMRFFFTSSDKYIKLL